MLPLDRPPLNDFNPQDHREPKSPIKLWMAYFNLLRTVFGAGVLGLPLAISQAGLILGPLLAFCTGVLITHTHLMLLKSLNEVSRQLKVPYISYRYGFRIALLRGPRIFQWVGKRGPTFVANAKGAQPKLQLVQRYQTGRIWAFAVTLTLIAVFMVLSQVGICSVFVAFTTDSLRDLMDWQTSQPAMLALLLPYLLLEFFMRTLKIVSYVSMLGNFMNLIGLVLVFYHIFDEPHGELVFASIEALPLLFAFGTFLFNLSAVGVVLSIDKAMQNPKVMTNKCGVVTIGIMVPTSIAIVFGTLGYWSFGTMEENILRCLPFDSDSALTAIGLYLIAIAFAYPIQCYPAIQIIIEVIKNKSLNFDDAPTEKTLRRIESIARPLFVLTSFIVCYLIPFQGPFVAFVGNLCTTFLALIFPAMMELSLMYPGPYGRYNVYYIKDILIIILGLISFTFGVVFCGYLIYIRLLSMNSIYETEYL